MANLIETKTGLTIQFTPANRVKLSKFITSTMEEKGLTLEGLSAATTMSPVTIKARIKDKGKYDMGEFFSPWAFVALADGLGLDPKEMGRRFGVTLSDELIDYGRQRVESRKSRAPVSSPTRASRTTKREPSQPKATETAPKVKALADGDASVSALEALLDAHAERFVQERLGPMVERSVEKALGLVNA